MTRAVHLVDTAVLVVLCWLPALLLIPAYGTPAPLWLAGAGVLLSSAVVVGTLVLRWPWWTSIPLAAVLLLLLGPVLVGDGIGIGASADFARSADTGWRNLLTVATPVGVSADLLTPPLLVGAAAALVAQLLLPTRRWSLALVPAAVAAMLDALLATGAGVRWQSVALLRAAVWLGLGWAAWRRQRGARQIRPKGARWQRPVAEVAVLAVGSGAALPLVLNRSEDRLALRTDLAVPVDPQTLPSPLSDFRRMVGDEARSVQFTVDGVRPGDRVRVAALDAYDGQTFTATDDEGPFARIGASRPAATVGTDRSVSVTTQQWADAWVPTVGELTSVTFGSQQLTDAFRYSAAALTGLMPAGLPAGTSWRQRGNVPSTTTVIAGDRLQSGTFPPTVPIPDALRVAAGKYAAGATSPGDQLAKIATGLSTTGYFSHGADGQLRSPSGHGLDRLLGMVGSTGMVGDSEQYAALMTVLARALGIPARVVVGFLVPAGTASNATPLTGGDYTAWVEVAFQQSGWVAFDPTPPQTRNSLDTQPQTEAGRHIPDNQPPPAAAGADAAQVQAGDSQQNPDQDQPDTDDPNRADGAVPWWLWPALALVGLGLLLMLPVLAIVGLKGWRRRSRQRTPSPNARVRGAWREILDRSADLGIRPDPGATRREVADLVWRSTAVDTRPLAEAADQAQFAPVAVDSRTADVRWAQARSSSDALLAGKTFSTRWRARLSLASLRRGS